MSFYVIARSGDSRNHFPNNTPHTFRVMLNTTLRFNPQEWSVGLCELYCDNISLSDTTSNSGSGGEVYVNTNVCQTSLVGESEQRLLRRIVLHHKKTYLDATFNPVFYLPVVLSECRDVLIDIRDVLGRSTSFIRGPVTATLHFRRRPFILWDGWEETLHSR